MVHAHGGRVTAHGYEDPAAIFKHALQYAPWNAVEGTLKDDGSELIVTVRLGGNKTVTAGYARYSGVARVFHCGEVTSGVGYGTLLG